MRNPFRRKPDNSDTTLELSVVVILYRMSRVARRTLLSLTAGYQQGMRADQYEVLIYENDSDDRLPDDVIEWLPPNFAYTLIDSPHQSPVFALNRGIRAARGKVIGAMIDGARILSPGLLRNALRASRLGKRTLVTTMGWYLGIDAQNEAHGHGYSIEREDALLNSIGWPANGHRLFEISVPDPSATDGWVSPIRESQALFMHREMWSAIGGYNEGFTSVGGGIANLELLRRACEAPGTEHVLLADEATFHQSHGGVASQATPEKLLRNIDEWVAEYQRVCGKPYAEPAQHDRVLLGSVRDEAIQHWRNALMHPFRARFGPGWKPLHFPRVSPWHPSRGIRASVEPPAAGTSGPSPLLEWLQALFAQERYVDCREACRKSLAALGHGRNPQIERLLASCCNVWVDPSTETAMQKSLRLSAQARTLLLLGSSDDAHGRAMESLELCPDNGEAHAVLIDVLRAGGSVEDRMADLHGAVAPRLYLEINQGGTSLVDLARPPARAILASQHAVPLGAPTVELLRFPVDGRAFLSKQAETALGGRTVDLALIHDSGDPEFILACLSALEAYCVRDSVVAISGTLPVIAAASADRRPVEASAGEAWKLVPYLAEHRDDLQIVTLPAAPSGLTLLKGLGSGTSLMSGLEIAPDFDFQSYHDNRDQKWDRPNNLSASIAEFLS